jgi:hypothetical protein
MTTPEPEPRWLAAGGRRLFSVLHRPPAPPRAGVLVCPPLLNEHARSYRLFALLADALAAHGLAVLRFDYHGTGDSDGEDADFTLDSARSDSGEALGALRRAVAGAPLVVLGVRAGAIPAIHAATAGGAAALWLWQPCTDGADYLAELQARDAARRRAHPAGLRPGEAQMLMGLRCTDALAEGLRAARLESCVPGAAPPVTVLDAAGGAAAPGPVRRIDLAAPLHDWIGQPGMGRFPRAPVHALAQRLAATLD